MSDLEIFCPLGFIGNNSDKARLCMGARCMLWYGECVMKMFFMGIPPVFDDKSSSMDVDKAVA